VVKLDTLESLKFKLDSLSTTSQNKIIITKRFKYIELLSNTSTEYQKNINWLRYALNFPFNIIKNTPISIDSSIEDLSMYVLSVYSKLDDYIYGMKHIKEEILSFVCKRVSNPLCNNNILALHGGNGVGKTRLAYGLANALDLPIRTINLGCISDVSYLTGHNFTYVDSEPGRIVQILNEVQCKNCIIYFDELDKIHSTNKGQTINAFLTHLIDYSQNKKYQDVYLSGLELDLSKVFFIFSFNDTNLLDKTVKDRLKILSIPQYSSRDQISIIKNFIIPDVCKNINYDINDLNIPDYIFDDILEKIVHNNKSNDGLRHVYHILDNIISKLNVLRMLTDQEKQKFSYYHPDLIVCILNILKDYTPVDQKDYLHFYM